MSKPYLCQVEGLPDISMYPFDNGDIVVVLGEIEQMPDHMVVATRDGKVHSGYHKEWFRKLSKDEV